MQLKPGISLTKLVKQRQKIQKYALRTFKVNLFNQDKQEDLSTEIPSLTRSIYCDGKTHHDSDLSLVDVQVRDVVDVHPFESAADTAVRTSQKNHREAS